MVGTQTGRANEQQQGTGFATILKGDKSYEQGVRASDKVWLLRQQKQAQQKTAADAAMKQLKTLNPEYYYLHNTEMQTALSDLQEKGAQLLSGGIVDPFHDTTPQAIEWQKQYAKTMQMAQTSKQIGETDKQMRTKLMTIDPNEYEPQGIVDYNAWLNQPLSESVNNPRPAPVLVKKRVIADSFAQARGLSKTLKDQYGDNPIPESAYISAAREQFSNETFKSTYTPNLLAMLSPERMSESELEGIRSRAKINALSEPEQLYVERAIQSEKMGEPFNLDKNMKASFADLTPDYIEGGNQERSWKNFDKKKLEKEVYTRANNFVASNLHFIVSPEAEKIVPRDPNDTDSEYKTKWRDKVVVDSPAYFNVDTKSMEYRDAEKGRQDELAVTGEAFWKDLLSGVPIQANSAANYLNNTTFAGADVANAYFESGDKSAVMGDDTRFKGAKGVLHLKLSGLEANSVFSAPEKVRAAANALPSTRVQGKFDVAGEDQPISAEAVDAAKKLLPDLKSIGFNRESGYLEIPVGANFSTKNRVLSIFNTKKDRYKPFDKESQGSAWKAVTPPAAAPKKKY